MNVSFVTSDMSLSSGWQEQEYSHNYDMSELIHS
jgi:hypothetical protein